MERTTGKTAYRVIKRVFDIVFSALVIVIGFIPSLIIMLIIAIDLKCRPLFVEERVGHKGPFPCIKFRTMIPHENPERVLGPDEFETWAIERKIDDDPRATSFGRILRATSIDELPQFLNVFAGQMSVVGPRAVTRAELEEHLNDADRARYLSVPSGITGLWQVGPRSKATWQSGRRQKIELDYVRRASLKLDAAIMVRTLKVMFIKRSGK